MSTQKDKSIKKVVKIAENEASTSKETKDVKIQKSSQTTTKNVTNKPSKETNDNKASNDKKNKSTKINHHDETEDDKDVMQSLLNTVQFDTPAKKKVAQKLPTSKEIEIDFEKDSQEEIIKKLVLSNKKLQTEFNEYKQYVDGTYCSSTEFNRYNITTDKQLSDLENRVDEIEKSI